MTDSGSSPRDSRGHRRAFPVLVEKLPDLSEGERLRKDGVKALAFLRDMGHVLRIPGADDRVDRRIHFA
jgi:hypothetical protein